MAAKPPQLREKLKEATTREILAAAEAELAAHGVSATGMSAIAKRAGVSVGTLYNYFKDKEVLLETLLTDRRKQFRAVLEQMIASHDTEPFEARLTHVVTEMLELYETHRDFLRIMMSADVPMPKHSPTQFGERLKPLTDAGVREGVLADVDADLYPGALAGLIKAVMFERAPDPMKKIATAAPFVVRLFLEGARKT